MTIQLDRIDRITDYDEAISALEEYVADLVEEFVESPEGKAYLQAHPEMAEYVGSWIDHLLYFGYAYQSVTLPRMKKTDVETIVTVLFPQKVSLQDPEEANTTIPELIAFWEFLKRAYKHSQASKIITFLKKIQPKFKGLMNDPSNFGMAKSFFSAGTAAGFDMTSEAGLKAFQEEYNQNLRNSAGPPPGLSAMLGNAGISLNPSADAPPPAELMELLNSLASLAESEGFGDLVEEMLPEAGSIGQELRSNMWQNTAEELPPVSDQTIALLNQQTISETAPGTILKDFQMLLEAIGEAGLPVSGTHHLISQKLLPELNQRLSRPTQLDLKRPVQKSYPTLNGLYLLLRASGLGQVISKGKTHYLTLHPEILASWNTLNPTERYLTLLEAWMIRADEEMLGERRSPLNEGTKCVQHWRFIPDAGQTFKSYSEQQSLNYWPELHNVALMDLFGFVELETGKPETGKGWRVKTLKRSPFGDAIMQIMVRAFVEQGMEWESETNPSLPFNDLQPAFQSYFPEWQTTLAVPQSQSQAGVYVFKVSLGKAWRRIAISSDQTLFDFSRLILESVDFGTDHLDMFTYRNPNGRTIDIHHPYSEERPSAEEICIGELPLTEGSTMTYIFDFGDWWEFRVQLESIRAEDARSNYGEILERCGTAPPQYPDWDEEE